LSGCGFQPQGFTGWKPVPLRVHFKTSHCEESGLGRTTKQSSWIATPGSAGLAMTGQVLK